MDEDDEVIKSTFELWLHYLFYPDEYVSDPNYYDWVENRQIEVEYIGRLFASPVELMQSYTDSQINRALHTLINESEDYMYELFNEEIPLELRVQVVKDMYIVFEQLFAPRCSHAQSHLHRNASDSSKVNPLNSICFMW